MKTKTVTVKCPNGLHLREAARIVEQSRMLKSRITICRDCRYADGCSILDLLLLDASEGAELMVTAEGEDEERAIKVIAGLMDGAGI